MIPAPAAGQMPSHWGPAQVEHRQQVLRVPARNSCKAVGSRRSHALLRGTTQGGWPKRRKRRSANTSITSAKKSSMFRAEKGRDQRGRVLGILETWACAKKLPLLYLVEDNGYAISVAGGSSDGRREHLENSCGTFPGCTWRNANGHRSHRKLLRLQGSGAVLAATAAAPALNSTRTSTRPLFRIRSPMTKKLYKTAEERRRKKRAAIRFQNLRFFLVREGHPRSEADRKPGSGNRQ